VRDFEKVSEKNRLSYRRSSVVAIQSLCHPNHAITSISFKDGRCDLQFFNVLFRSRFCCI